MCCGGLDAKTLMRDAEARLAGLPVRSLRDAEPAGAAQGIWPWIRAFLHSARASGDPAKEGIR
jgi:hypothetical protein